MKTTFAIEHTPFAVSIADISVFEDMYEIDEISQNNYIVNRINVHRNYRGKGYGSRLLKKMLDEADANSATLYLWAFPSGSLSYDELIAWYERHGFVKIIVKPYEDVGIWQRLPVSAPCPKFLLIG